MTVNEFIVKAKEKYTDLVISINGKKHNGVNLLGSKEVIAWELNKENKTLDIYVKDKTLKIDVDFIMARAATMRANGITKQQANEILGKSTIRK
jgi:NAD(P)H-dependent flavin oxidoreductase YrpB (nitropropane dioxygenase family)